MLTFLNSSNKVLVISVAFSPLHREPLLSIMDGDCCSGTDITIVPYIIIKLSVQVKDLFVKNSSLIFDIAIEEL
jgi:hypothetical protein